MCQQIAILATQEFTNCPSSESTMRQQLNSLVSYHLSEDACMEIYRTVVYKLDALLTFSVLSIYCFTICHSSCCSANCSTFSCGNSKSAGLANAYMDGQILDAILCEPCITLPSIPKWPQKQFQNT